MRIGFGAPVSGVWATPANLASFTAQAEAAGYASVWTFQRLIVPEGSAMEPVYHSVRHHRVEHAVIDGLHRGALGDDQPLERPHRRVAGRFRLGGEAGQVGWGSPGAGDGGAETDPHALTLGARRTARR